MNKQIINLYDHFKNAPKKLKIICDWDEVIQVHESYCLWKAIDAPNSPNNDFTWFFKEFWNKEGSIEYSPYGSKIKQNNLFAKGQEEIKTSSDLYRNQPFLTVAEDLLKLIKEDKVEKLIFLSAYDKRKFPDGRRKCPDCFASTGDDTKKEDWEPCEKCPITSGDPRKLEIFLYTFNKFTKTTNEVNGKILPHNLQVAICKLKLIGFDSETQGQTKADWIKENASDFDLVIDDNPNICKEVIKSNLCEECKYCDVPCSECPEKQITVIAPYYPAVAEQHHPSVLLIKTSVSDLKKEDFLWTSIDCLKNNESK
jgi:hypothetical protein